MRKITCLLLLLCLLPSFALADKTITLTFTGDITLGGEDYLRTAEDSFFAVYECEGAGYFLKNFADFFAEDDLTVVNLEGVLTDNNALYDTDALQSLRNAKAQGALVMHNHPGWRRKSLEHPEFEVKAYGEGLIDGIEIMNGAEFYPKAIARAHARKLFVSANTDIHDATAETYRLQGHSRNMTLIFARNNSLEALREALEARRTLAYSFGTIAGDEQLLKDLFTASVRTKVLHTDPSNGRRTVSLTNSSSVEYVLRFPGQNPVVLKPFSTLMTTVGRDKPLDVTVENMWYSEKDHPRIEINL